MTEPLATKINMDVACASDSTSSDSESDEYGEDIGDKSKNLAGTIFTTAI